MHSILKYMQICSEQHNYNCLDVVILNMKSGSTFPCLPYTVYTPYTDEEAEVNLN